MPNRQTVVDVAPLRTIDWRPYRYFDQIVSPMFRTA